MSILLISVESYVKDLWKLKLCQMFFRLVLEIIHAEKYSICSYLNNAEN